MTSTTGRSGLTGVMPAPGPLGFLMGRADVEWIGRDRHGRTARRAAGRSVRPFRLVQLARASRVIGDGLACGLPTPGRPSDRRPSTRCRRDRSRQLPWLLVALPAGASSIAGSPPPRGHRGAARAVVLTSSRSPCRREAPSASCSTVFLIGVGETMVASASHAVLPELVPPSGLATPTARSSPPCTRPRTSSVRPRWRSLRRRWCPPLPVDAVSFALAALLLALALPTAAGRRDHPPGDPPAPDIAEGFRYFGHVRAAALGGLIASLAFCQAIVFGPLVLFALHGLGLSDAGYGLLLGLAAIGNVLGGTVAGRLDDHFGARLLLPAGGLLAAAAYAVCGLASSLAVAAVALGIEAIAVAIGNVANLTLRQRLIPSELLGRVGNMRAFLHLRRHARRGARRRHARAVVRRAGAVRRRRRPAARGGGRAGPSAHAPTGCGARRRGLTATRLRARRDCSLCSVCSPLRPSAMSPPRRSLVPCRSPVLTADGHD